MARTLDLSSKVCSNLLLCQKNIKLYPKDHPRVGHSLQQIQEDLALFFRERGRPLCISSLENAVEPERRDLSGVWSNLQLGRLLKLNLIEELTIFPEVTEEELLQLCEHLQEDPSKQDADAEDALLRDHESWKSIRLSFYEPQDLPEDVSSSEKPMRRRAGIQEAGSLAPVLDKLPREVRQSVQKALLDPPFLLKISRLRRSFESNARRPDDPEAEVNLIAELIGSVLPDDDGRRNEVSADELVATIHRLVDFMEGNRDILAGAIKSFTSDADCRTFGEHLSEVIQSGNALASKASVFQSQKERLAFLFQTAGQAEEMALPGDAGPPPHGAPRPEAAAKTEDGRAGNRPADRPERQGGGVERPEAALEEELRKIHYDVDAIRSDFERTDPELLYLHIVLELLAREKHPNGVRRNWKRVVRTILEASRSESFRREAISEVAGLVRRTENPHARKLLFALLGSDDNSERTLRTIEEVLLPAGGLVGVQEYVEHVTRKDPGGAVPFLCAACRQGTEDLKRIAREALVSVAINPLVLSEWALNDPGDTLDSETLAEILARLSPNQIRDAFKAFFSRASEAAAERLMRRFPGDVTGAEHVLYAAMDYGSPPTRNRAIENLSKYPSSMTISTLKGIINHNNSRVVLSMGEVKAALGALVRMRGEEEEVESFLKEVLRKRRLLRHVYHREIRKTLKVLLSEKEST